MIFLKTIFLLSCVFLLIKTTALSQTIKNNKKRAKIINSNPVVYYRDTIYHNAIPYTVMKKIQKELLLYDYNLLSLTGKQLVYFKNNSIETFTVTKRYYKVIFINSKKKAEIAYRSSGKLAKLIVESGLIQSDTINSEAEENFILFHDENFSNQEESTVINVYLSPSSTNDKYLLVERNRMAMIMIIGREIKQDGITIGKIDEKTNAIYGKLYKIYSIYLPNDIKTAEASLLQFNSAQCKLITLKDNQTHYISVHTINPIERQKQIVKFLIDRYYL